MHNSLNGLRSKTLRLWQVGILPAFIVAVPFFALTAAEPVSTNTPPARIATNSTPALIVTNAPDRLSIEAASTDVVYDDIAVFTEALLLVKRQYADDKAFRDLIYGAIDGMLVSLDPHSGFLQPQQYQELREDTSGHFSGIGIHVGIKEGRVLVLAPIEGAPAHRAGLMSGDKIVKIDGQPALGISMDETVRRLRGAKGSPVKLTIEREGRDLFDVTLLRDDVKVASVKGARILRDGVGYIRLMQFGEGSTLEFLKALQSLQDQKMTALVVDLRDNPGGLLATAVEVTSLLLPKGTEIVSVRGRDGTRSEERHVSNGPLHLTDLPTAVLVNSHSASASEIMAGALQDHHRAVIVGETTFGKASVQNVLRLSTRPDCAVRLTTAHYYTPAGRMIHGKGIVPDISIEVPLSKWRSIVIKRAYAEMPEIYPAATREKVEDVPDEQLNRAIDVVIGVRILKQK
ncbi:MAG: S41 family peptidase [bacterium]